MSAAHLGELLSAYLDGEATGDEEERVVLHLDGCGACRDELLELDAARAAVRSLPVLEPAGFADKITREQPVVTVPLASAAAPSRRRVRPVAWAAAAAAALVLAVGGVGMARSGTGGAALEMDEMMGRHAVRVSVDPGLSAVQIVQVIGP